MPKTIDRKESQKVRKILWFFLNHPQLFLTNAAVLSHYLLVRYLIQALSYLDGSNYSSDELAFALGRLIEHADSSYSLKLVYYLMEHEFSTFQVRLCQLYTRQLNFICKQNSRNSHSSLLLSGNSVARFCHVPLNCRLLN